MEIFGGFMVMMSIISLFLAVVWLIMPFVVFAIKGKQDRTLEVLEGIEKRLADLELLLRPAVPEQSTAAPTLSCPPSVDVSEPDSNNNTGGQVESAARPEVREASPAE